MPHSTLISAAELAALQSSPTAVAVFDCSFDLTDPGAGPRLHAQARVPGARYLHLDEDLSSAKTGRNGRHPLPTREAFANRMAALGLDDDTQVVAYDASGGMFAVRLWWMLRWTGHASVAVLDGGLPAWRAAGLPVASGPASPAATGVGRLRLRPSLAPTVTREDLLANVKTGERLVVDARSPDRFRGENETLDPVGGRIPGAVNRFFKDNLGADGRFKPAAQLRAELQATTGGRAAQSLVFSCGSGVTACHNLLAMEVAGLGGAALYPGSWSEWSSWPDAPVASGPA